MFQHLMYRCRAGLLSVILILSTLLGDAIGADTTDPDFHSVAATGEIHALLIDSDGKILLGGSFVQVNGVHSPCLVRVNFDGTLDTGFNPASIENGSGARALVRALAQMADGRIYLEGEFTRVGGQPRSNLARLQPDGSLDPTFVPAVASSGCLTLQPDGQIVTGNPVVRLRRDGMPDPLWKPYSGFSSTKRPTETRAQIQPDGRVLVVLHYEAYLSEIIPWGGNYVERLFPDGTPDPSFQRFRGNYSPLPMPVLQDNGKVLWLDPLSRFQGTGVADEAYRTGLEPLSLTGGALQNDNSLVICGSFQQIDGQPRPRLAQFLDDGRLDLRFDPKPPPGFAASVVGVQPTGDVLAGGAFQEETGKISWRVFRFLGDRQSGTPVIREQPVAITAMAGFPAGLTVRASGYPMPEFQWQFQGTNLPGATQARLNWPRVLEEQSGKYALVVSNALGQVRSDEVEVTVLSAAAPTIIVQPVSQTVDPASLIELSVTATNLLDLYYQWQFNGSALAGATNRTLTVTNVLKPGAYTVIVSNAVGTVTSDPALLTVRPAERDPGSLDPTFFAETVPAGSRGGVLEVDGSGRIYLDVELALRRLQPNGLQDEAFQIAAISGGPWERIGQQRLDWTTLDGFSFQRDGKVLIHGIFTVASGKSHNQVARLNQDGTVDETFQTDPGQVIAGITHPIPIGPRVRQVMELADGRILMAGDFSDVSGVHRPGLIKLNTNGAPDLSFDAGPVLAALGYTAYSTSIIAVAETAADGALTVAGWFAAQSRTRIVQLSTDGTLNTSFKPVEFGGSGGDTPIVSALQMLPDGRILAGGLFKQVNGLPQTNLVRLLRDGSIDPDFASGSGPDGAIEAILLQPDAKIIIVGPFTSYQSASRNQIARLHADGSLDTSFDPGPGPDGKIVSAALQTDGDILVSGNFTNFNGVLRPRVARLFGAELPGPPVVELQSTSAEVIAGQDVLLSVTSATRGRVASDWTFRRNRTAVS